MSTARAQANVLVTGGSEGIGFGLARRYAAAGARVLVTGRNADRLDRAAAASPRIKTIVNDISKPEAREALAAHVRKAMRGLNVVINNAGIQRRIPLAADAARWPERQVEIDTLLSGPIHLNHLLIPQMLAHGAACLIVNVTSGAAFVPQPFAPIYAACKAALHSYTVNLRFALAHTACRVVELIPPAVATGLAGPGATHGAPLDDFCDAVFVALCKGDDDEIGYGVTASESFAAPRRLYQAMFEQFSERFPVQTYADK
jgi:uncharacterized oxidoreductase